MAILAAVSLPTGAGAACLSYDRPQTLEGVLSMQTFPGAPNFEDVKAGDEAERVPILTLKRPVCVNAAGEGDPMNEAVPSLRTVQVIAPGGKVDWKLVGRAVVATGEIFHSHTGHHHAPVLIDAKTVRAAK